MADSKELKKIKKKYGENFMKLCRDFFPTILEKEGRLEEILSMSFAGNSRTLYEDIVNARLEGEFKNYIYSKIDIEDPEKKLIVEKTPYELLDEAGYVLTECLTEKEIQSFKRYYKPGEELCTFYGERLDKCVVFFAVKKDANEIKRENFKNPRREDEYGTSVMGIQFNREGLCTVSIKNRYNHTVNNPDATYGNDLDRIVPGLTESFSNLLRNEYNLNLNVTNIDRLHIPGYVVANDGKYYKYNMELDTVYYCPGNVIIKNGEVTELENPESQILMDYFILDIKNKELKIFDSRVTDSFIDGLQDLKDAQIRVEKSKGSSNKTRIITIQKSDKEPIVVEINSNNQIIRYENYELEQLRDNFLCFNKVLTDLNLPKLELVGDDFLFLNQMLTSLDLPNLKIVGDGFMACTKNLISLNLPKLREVGKFFLYNSQDLADMADTISLYLEKNEKTLQPLTNVDSIDSKNIAILDEKNALTSDEVNLAQRIVEKTGKLFRDKDKTDR